MPKPRPPGTFNGGGLSFVDWLCSFFAWQIVRDTGATIYQQNAITGARSASRITGGHQPIDTHWLETGEWSPPPKPPSGGPTERRAADPEVWDKALSELRLDCRPSPRAGKLRVRVPYRRGPNSVPQGAATFGILRALPGGTGGAPIRPNV